MQSVDRRTGGHWSYRLERAVPSGIKCADRRHMQDVRPCQQRFGSIDVRRCCSAFATPMRPCCGLRPLIDLEIMRSSGAGDNRARSWTTGPDDTRCPSLGSAPLQLANRPRQPRIGKTCVAARRLRAWPEGASLMLVLQSADGCSYVCHACTQGSSRLRCCSACSA